MSFHVFLIVLLGHSSGQTDCLLKKEKGRTEEKDTKRASHTVTDETMGWKASGTRYPYCSRNNDCALGRA